MSIEYTGAQITAPAEQHVESITRIIGKQYKYVDTFDPHVW